MPISLLKLWTLNLSAISNFLGLKVYEKSILWMSMSYLCYLLLVFGHLNSMIWSECVYYYLYWRKVGSLWIFNEFNLVASAISKIYIFFSIVTSPSNGLTNMWQELCWRNYTSFFFFPESRVLSVYCSFLLSVPIIIVELTTSIEENYAMMKFVL